ncbi:hypothetical protein CMK11_09380 [Candidatus Poribacteria bacterium]|nr:hypothetical protein [Candidatus Poribacteria bacterium]
MSNALSLGSLFVELQLHTQTFTDTLDRSKTAAESAFRDIQGAADGLDLDGAFGTLSEAALAQRLAGMDGSSVTDAMDRFGRDVRRRMIEPVKEVQDSIDPGVGAALRGLGDSLDHGAVGAALETSFRGLFSDTLAPTLDPLSEAIRHAPVDSMEDMVAELRRDGGPVFAMRETFGTDIPGDLARVGGAFDTLRRPARRDLVENDDSVVASALNVGAALDDIATAGGAEALTKPTLFDDLRVNAMDVSRWLRDPESGLLGSMRHVVGRDAPEIFGDFFADTLVAGESFGDAWNAAGGATDRFKQAWRGAVSDSFANFLDGFFEPVSARLGQLGSSIGSLGGSVGSNAGGSTLPPTSGGTPPLPPAAALPGGAVLGLAAWFALAGVALAHEGNDWRASGKTLTWQSLPQDVQRRFSPTGEQISAASARTMRVLVLAHKRSSWRYALSVSFAAGATRNGDLTAHVETARRIFHEGSAHQVQPTDIALRLMQENQLSASDIGLPAFWRDVANGALRVLQTSDGVLQTITNAEALARETFSDITQDELDLYRQVFAQSGPNAAAQSVVATRRNAAAGAGVDTKSVDGALPPGVRSIAQALANATAVNVQETLLESRTGGVGLIPESDEIPWSAVAAVARQLVEASGTHGFSLADIPISTSEGDVRFGEIFNLSGLSSGQLGTNNVNLFKIDAGTIIASEGAYRELAQRIVEIANQEGLALRQV